MPADRPPSGTLGDLIDSSITLGRWIDPALAAPLLGVLAGAAVAAADSLRDQAVAFLCAGDNEPLVPALVRMLRAAARAGKPATAP